MTGLITIGLKRFSSMQEGFTCLKNPEETPGAQIRRPLGELSLDINQATDDPQDDNTDELLDMVGASKKALPETNCNKTWN